MPTPLRSFSLPVSLLGCAAALSAQAPPPSKADAPKPWRLQEAAGLPDWLRMSGEARLRYETLHDQFRAGAALGDHEDLWLLRTNLLTEVALDPLTVAVELLDSRAYGVDDTTPVDTTLVNAIDVLQANAAVDLGKLGDGTHRLVVGRETMNLGSRRLVARNQFRNTINAFTGIDWEWQTKDAAVRTFWTLPVRRRPSDFASLEDNEPEFDDQDLDVQFWGAHATLPVGERTNFEAYVLALDESGNGTRRRELFTPGARFVRAAKVGDFDHDLESAVQFGESRTSTSATAPDLDHLAWSAHVSVGYTFDVAWRPNVRLAYDYASGDSDPNDGDNGRFDTLFGARRFDFGPTDLWGAFARSNISSPELRVTVKPTAETEVLVAWRDVHLAAERDAWTTAGVRDASGASGDHVGQQLEARLRYDLVPRSVRFECGAAFLFAESFLDRAPNGGGRDASYGYFEVSWRF